MHTALQWANEIATPTTLPEELAPLVRRVELVEEFERKIMAEYLDSLVMADANKDQFHRLSHSEKTEILRRIAEFSKSYMPGVSEEDRISITLRLWSGCVMAGKAIALETKEGPTTRNDRQHIFSSVIDPLARGDAVYRAGVEAAPRWKSGRKQGVSYMGVPQGSSVRRYSG